MKEMQYAHLGSAITLDHDSYQGYEYLVVNFGSHPACYIRLRENHPYYNKDFWNMKIKPHSDLSFGGTLEKYHLDGFWIGWEYDLFGDYVYGRTRDFITDGWHHKYTTKELVDKIHQVIRDLIEISPNDVLVEEDLDG